MLFLLGMAINVHSDCILRNLRKPGEVIYKIPKGNNVERLGHPTAFHYFWLSYLWSHTFKLRLVILSHHRRPVWICVWCQLLWRNCGMVWLCHNHVVPAGILLCLVQPVLHWAKGIPPSQVYENIQIIWSIVYWIQLQQHSTNYEALYWPSAYDYFFLFPIVTGTTLRNSKTTPSHGKLWFHSSFDNKGSAFHHQNGVSKEHHNEISNTQAGINFMGTFGCFYLSNSWVFFFWYCTNCIFLHYKHLDSSFLLTDNCSPIIILEHKTNSITYVKNTDLPYVSLLTTMASVVTKAVTFLSKYCGSSPS